MSKRIILIITMLISFIPSLSYAECTVEAYFSPYENIEEIVLNELNNAGGSIRCSLYGITNTKITETLINRVSSRVDIKLCLDKVQSAGKHSTHKQLENAGIDVVVKKTGVLEHNKFCVIDNKTVIMGSWNFSNTAQKQDNSIVVMSGCEPIIEKFNKAFTRIYQRDKK